MSSAKFADVIARLPRLESACQIALIAGGDSDERQVSLWSGAAAERALRARGHVVVHLDPAVVDLAGVDWRHFDLAFLTLHGSFGEDGQVQQLLDGCRVPYTGSPARACQQSFRKSVAKAIFAAQHLPTPAGKTIHRWQDRSYVEWLASEIGYPVVIKPESQGSSLGVSIVRRRTELYAALERCFELDEVGLIEQAMLGEEWTVGVFEGTALPPIRIETTREFYDYHAKYIDNDTCYHLDHSDRSPAWLTELCRVSEAACAALGTRGMARVDLRTDAAGAPHLLEVNTIPGLTDHSLVPKAAAYAGVSFVALCEAMAVAALMRLPSSVSAPHWQASPSGSPLFSSHGTNEVA